VKRTLLSTILVASLVIGFMGVANASTSAKSPISVRVTLSRTEVVAGRSIRGEAVLTNSGTKTVLVQACAYDGWLFVGLANKQISYSPAIATVACMPSVRLTPGINRFSITVVTTYQECGGTTSPRCPKSGAPALPKGKYHTEVKILGLPSGTQKLSPISVTLN
jgi:hypothetical protein